MALPTIGIAGSMNGTLFTDGDAGFDFYSPSVFEKSKWQIQYGGEVKLQARFVWDGSNNEVLTGDGHAIVAFTQGQNAAFRNSPSQPVRQNLFTHGVGAFVHPNGLHLELWFDAGKAHVWSKDQRCGVGIRTPNPNACLASSSTQSASYITSPVKFSLKKGTAYWVRIAVTSDPSNSQFAVLRASLLEETPTGIVLHQEGAIGFMPSTFLPYSENLKGTIGRTPQSGNNITYSVFDYGF
ncbi:hypothetical protein [Chitinivorax sp. B]|uniref:hypothetical protein n=1 Tax=Chitinivorax sp. B TaxID=2502235 RepID=UPI0010F9EE61|nr:hypothetical protein [Chitinivorax sp. B]